MNTGNVGIIPSRIWAEGVHAIWSSLSLRERGLLLLGATAPMINQISGLASFWVIIQAINYGIRKPLELEIRLWLGLVILVASLVSICTQILSDRVTKTLKAQNMRMIRRMYGTIMAEASKLTCDKRKQWVKQVIDEEKTFVSSSATGVSAAIEFLAAIFLVVGLLGILAWFDWIVGAILLVSGLVTLMILRHKIKTQNNEDEEGNDGESDKIVKARQSISQKLEFIGSRRRNLVELIEDYANNELDQLAMDEADSKMRIQKKISSAMNYGSAIIMVVVFLLVSTKGAFDANKIVWMVVFIIGLRMVVLHGKTAMVKWGVILSKKTTLMRLMKAGIAWQTPREEVSDVEAEDDDDADVEMRVEDDSRGIARIVDYSFRGVNGAEVVSRKPLIVEMCVEAREAIEGVSWSFAISNMDGTSFLITKTTADHGIIWDIPKGKSWFRVVTGPVWLPAGTFSGWIGIAKGNQTLDLIGSQAEPKLLHVLPDETVKRMVPIREIRDVVAMDVEWDQEFRNATSESWKAGEAESEHFRAN